MFDKKDRSTFPYWFANWCAFQMTALNLKCWKPKFLLHDIEKPWLMKIWKDYKRVQSYHRRNNDHHMIHYILTGKADWTAMIVDWECSRFTKSSAQLNACQEWEKQFSEIEIFLENFHESKNKTCQFIYENISKFESMSEFVDKFRVAYFELAAVLKKLGFEPRINNDYLMKAKTYYSRYYTKTN